MIFKSRRVLVSVPQGALLLEQMKTAEKGGNHRYCKILAGVKCVKETLEEIGRLPME